MPRIALSNLPVEVHFEIFKYSLYSSKRIKSEQLTDSAGSIEWEWIEQDRRSLSQFPYNVATVCRRWHSILIKIPECWTRVIIDIASNPQKFLDIFLWSKDLPKLEVTIFNSHMPDSLDINYSDLERGRVLAIIGALRPHISRCKSITFDVAFVTSLPSPLGFLLEDAPYLEELVLECKINNAGLPEDYSRICDLGVREPIETDSSFPELRYLSMTGFWFMFIAGHPYTSEWFTTIQHNAYRIGYCITQFQFQSKGHYTLQNFVSYCSELSADPVTLRDLSLNSDGPVLECTEFDEEVFCVINDVIFENVSPDVIQSIFLLAEVSPNHLVFDKCTFPNEILYTRAEELTIKNITHSSPPDVETAKDNTNLINILQGWIGWSLSVLSCPSFDDNVLSALPAFRDSTAQSLYLSNCNNFTVHGLRRYLERRNKVSTEAPHNQTSEAGIGLQGDRPLDNLTVVGSCPFPSKDDREWFETNVYAGPIEVVWEGRDPEDSREAQRFNKRASRHTDSQAGV